MIRAVYTHGSIVPLDQVPEDWQEGKSLRIEPETDWENPSPEEMQKWFDELEAMGPEEYEPGEKEKMEAVMAEADRQAKDYVRRQMGLP